MPVVKQCVGGSRKIQRNEYDGTKLQQNSRIGTTNMTTQTSQREKLMANTTANQTANQSERQQSQQELNQQANNEARPPQASSSRSQSFEQRDEPLGSEPHQLETLARDEWPDELPESDKSGTPTGEATGEDNPQQMRTTTTWTQETDLDQPMTWKPATAHGVNSQDELAVVQSSAFAFPAQRALPLLNADDVATAVQEFNSVADVTDRQREQAFNNISAAAAHYSVPISGSSWRNLGQ
jgi:hypothetical protein